MSPSTPPTEPSHPVKPITGSHLADALNPLETLGATHDAGTSLAAVAVIARAAAQPNTTQSTEFLFIQRATSAQDPWSGQMAFPGGRWEPQDESMVHTAQRETLEEIGLDLYSVASLGALDDLHGGAATNRPISVQPIVFWLGEQHPELTANYEVADIVWVGASELLDPRRHIQYYFPPSDSHFPGIQLDKADQVIWGLTLRMLSDLFTRLGYGFISL